VVDPIEFIPRGKGLGLGATPGLKKNDKKEKKYIKPGESREEKPEMGVAPGPDGKVRHYKSINERLIPVHRLQLRSGSLVEIMQGPHRRLYGRVVNYDPKTTEDSKVQVRLNLNQDEVIMVSKAAIEVLDEHATPDDHPAFKVGKPSASSASKRSRSRSKSPTKRKSKAKNKSGSRSRSRSRSPKKKKAKKSKSPEKAQKQEKVKEKEKSKKKDKKKDKVKEKSKSKQVAQIRWIRPHIRVRIISKKLGGGAHYNKKARVEDVVSQTAFTVVMEEGGKLIENVHEDDVETVIPKVGGAVLILSTSKQHKGEIGKVLEKNVAKAKAFIQLEGDPEIVETSFDDIAEYLGGSHQMD
jgi:G patch domain/KOW motif-containing protein